MKYSFDEIHALNLLSDNAEYSKRFNTPKDLKVVTLIILFILAVILAVAILFKVDKIVPAKGVLETKAELFAVRSNQQGYVHEVHVIEGDTVKADDLLVSFDTRLLDLDIDSLEQRLTSLSRALWSDFFQLAAIVPIGKQNELQARLASIPQPLVQTGWQAALTAPIEQALYQNEQAQLEVTTQRQQRQQELAVQHQALTMDQRQLLSMESLLTKQIESRVNVEQQQRQVLDTQSRINSTTSSIALLLLQEQRLNTDRTKLLSDFELERMERFYNNWDEYQQVNIELAKQTRIRQDMVILAPIDGTVDGVAIKGPKELLSANSTLLNLRPIFKQDDLLIEIQIPSSFAVWVEPGMPFRASAQGNNPDDHGYINGVVDFISESTSEDKQGGTRVYRMIGKITEFDLSVRGLEPAFLRPGMELNVQIKAGKRRLINYIFDPFTKHFRTAFSEPG